GGGSGVGDAARLRTGAGAKGQFEAGSGSGRENRVVEGQGFDGGGEDAAEGVGVFHLDGALIVIDGEGADVAAIISAQDDGAAPLDGELRSGGAADLSRDRQRGARVDGEELRAGSGAGELHVEADVLACQAALDDDETAAGNRGIAEGD